MLCRAREYDLYNVRLTKQTGWGARVFLFRLRAGFECTFWYRNEGKYTQPRLHNTIRLLLPACFCLRTDMSTEGHNNFILTE